MTPQEIPVPPRIGVVIVSAQEREPLVRTLEALSDSHSLVVVANGGPETAGLEEQFPRVRFIRLPRHFGLTRALNIGIRAAAGLEFLALVSPGVELSASDLDRLVATLEAEPSTGAVSPRLIDSEGSASPQVADLPTSADPDPPLRPAMAGERPACVTNDAIALRAFFFRAMRHIDERYGDYGSALEICQQIRRANKTILIHPEVTARAVISERGSTCPSDREVGTTRFLMKHYGFVTGTIYLLKRIAAALFTLRMGKALALIQLRKVDGS